MQLKDLKQDKRNYRKHNDRNISLIRKSVDDCGLGRSIVIDNENEIIAGNGLVSAISKNTPIKVIESTGKELIVVKRTDLSTKDEKRKKLAVMDNSASDSSEFDLELLSLDFDSFKLKEMGIDIETVEEETEVVEDEVPEEVETRCKKGDIWKLGNHRLMCGDSTVITDVEKLMNGQKADMVFTDPPYGMNLDTDYSKMNGSKKNIEFKQRKKVVGGKSYQQGKVDDFTPEMINTLFACFDYAKEMFLWGADYFAEMLSDKNEGSWIVWDKRDDNEQFDKMYGSSFELCWSKNKHKREIARVRWCGVFGTEQEFDKKRYHPTQKPTKLVQWFLDRYSQKEQKIVDLFGGSGSTLIACEQLNRKCYTMELDEHYCDVIIQRWENLTGKTAERIENENN